MVMLTAQSGKEEESLDTRSVLDGFLHILGTPSRPFTLVRPVIGGRRDVKNDVGAVEIETRPCSNVAFDGFEVWVLGEVRRGLGGVSIDGANHGLALGREKLADGFSAGLGRGGYDCDAKRHCEFVIDV
jgi:hypothetical protein